MKFAGLRFVNVRNKRFRGNNNGSHASQDFAKNGSPSAPEIQLTVNDAVRGRFAFVQPWSAPGSPFLLVSVRPVLGAQPVSVPSEPAVPASAKPVPGGPGSDFREMPSVPDSPAGRYAY